MERKKASMEAQALLALTLLCLFASGAYSVKFTITNNCPFTVWPVTLTTIGTELSTTGFKLGSKASRSLDAQAKGGWFGRFWGRTKCFKDPSSGNFTCASGDCGSGAITCSNTADNPQASRVELTLARNASSSISHDIYVIKLLDGFNLPVSIAPHNGVGACNTNTCPNNVNRVCPPELAVKGRDGSVVACKSACSAFHTPQFCCTLDFILPDRCQPNKYSKVFKAQCPKAVTYLYDNIPATGEFLCSGRPDYTITFCP